MGTGELGHDCWTVTFVNLELCVLQAFRQERRADP